MSWRGSFLKFAAIAGAIGVAVPLVLTFRWFVFQHSFGSVEGWLWPSSVMFMALDAPGTARSTVVFVYTVAIVKNALFYGLIGAITWLAVRTFSWFRQSSR
ncbi:hypothetical protein [Occallatibacter riparius]|uniref:Uncharacterized protein n=1 Tax=Occallatibacter riparius TaxID=1002689 RepID=A0A9J7BJE0_9BACT|nr:hypothetical protein [Occallatibacter riparius]UWZ83028.1 hypothetical protein MOP44_20955 [Occallatibacter riparius]